ncbi:MAG: hypothetical protein K8R77_00985 [Anaerolineaceae bacterium]|nr:hypothetical protein [Anaerolineaceae bacterium]
MYQDYNDEETIIREYLRETERKNWPDFLKNCRLLGLPPSKDDPMNWRWGFEADMYYRLPSQVIDQLINYLFLR